MKRNLLAIAGLALLLTAIDQLYRVLHPEVNLVRASLVGATAWLALAGLSRLGALHLPVRRGALAIFAAAFLSVLAIEAGWLVSRSPLSAAVHVGIVAVAYLALGLRYREPSSSASSARAEGSCGNASTSRRA